MIYNVYLISANFGNDTLYKIGYTKRKVEDRIKEFKTGNVSDFYIIESFRSKYGTKIESSLHRKFKHKKVGGEWFNLCDDDIYNFIESCQQLHEMFEVINEENTFYNKKTF